MDAELQEKIEQLRELKRAVDNSLAAMEADGLIEVESVVNHPQNKADLYEMILGGRFGITDLKKVKPSPHANLGAHQAEVEQKMKSSWKSGFGDET